MSYIEPLWCFFLLLTAAGAARTARRTRGRRPWLLLAGVAGLWAVSWPPVDWLATRPLEARYPVGALPPGDAGAIVVLSGDVLAPRAERPFAVPAEDTYLRCRYAAWLYRNWGPKPVLACGGPAGGASYAAAMRHVLETEGVPAGEIRTEEQSRSTHENALFGARILRSMGVSRIVLITDARHMLRAELCFRKEGLAVAPAPSRYRIFEGGPHEWLPGWRALMSSDYTLHESAGLLWYWLRGWV